MILTEGRGDDLSKQPYVIVSIGRGSPEQPDDRAAVRARPAVVGAAARYHACSRRTPCASAGLPGYEIRAQAKGLNGEPVMVAQWLRFSGGNYLRIVGVGRKDDWDALFTRFRAVRDGIELR